MIARFGNIILRGTTIGNGVRALNSVFTVEGASLTIGRVRAGS
ncbi:MAG: hypothetical protein U0X92_13300 [Anaerolineales bacterium]